MDQLNRGDIVEKLLEIKFKAQIDCSTRLWEKRVQPSCTSMPYAITIEGTRQFSSIGSTNARVKIGLVKYVINFKGES